MDIALVLNRIRPNAIWSLNENTYASLDWKDSSKKPSYSEIEKAWPAIANEIENEKIEDLRKVAYQKEADPLFFKYQRGEAEKSEWLEKIEEIKARYPYSAFSQE